MAKQPAVNVNITVSTVSLEDDINSFTLSIDQETPVSTSFADAGPRRLVGNYDYNLDIGGAADFAAAQSDATLFALVGASAVQPVTVDPTGVTADANNPNYDSADMLLASYSITGSVGGVVEYSANLVGNALLARAVA